ncbi:MAG TPA: PASTA domain-containing protein [Acidimicrobiales bacterium]|nr:PASTA domain-containing protein [Acidimicrobiales bacterium]
MIVVLIVGGVLALVVTFPSTGASSSTTTTHSTSSVPRFKGLSLVNARSLARVRGGRVFVALRIPSHSVTGIVLSQTPNPTWPVGLVISSGDLANNKEVLPGERTSPVGSECAVAIWLSEDGNAYPLTCSGHRVNVGAWLFYARNRPSIMSLPRATSLARVTASLCHFKIGEPKGFNLSEETLPEQEDVFMLAAAYNGWRVPKGLSCAQPAASP